MVENISPFFLYIRIYPSMLGGMKLCCYLFGPRWNLYFWLNSCLLPSYFQVACFDLAVAWVILQSKSVMNLWIGFWTEVRVRRWKRNPGKSNRRCQKGLRGRFLRLIQHQYLQGLKSSRHLPLGGRSSLPYSTQLGLLCFLPLLS